MSSSSGYQRETVSVDGKKGVLRGSENEEKSIFSTFLENCPNKLKNCSDVDHFHMQSASYVPTFL